MLHIRILKYTQYFRQTNLQLYRNITENNFSRRQRRAKLECFQLFWILLNEWCLTNTILNILEKKNIQSFVCTSLDEQSRIYVFLLLRWTKLTQPNVTLNKIENFLLISLIYVVGWDGYLYWPIIKIRHTVAGKSKIIQNSCGWNAHLVNNVDCSCNTLSTKIWIFSCIYPKWFFFQCKRKFI